MLAVILALATSILLRVLVAIIREIRRRRRRRGRLSESSEEILDLSKKLIDEK